MAEIKGSQYVSEDMRINAGLNVGFKIGTEANLKNLDTNKVQAGVFYLTSDTHRLYIGNKDHTLSPVNQGIITVEKLATVSNPIPGQFYYITENNSNILATWSGGRWVQMNPDTYIESLTTVVDGVTGNDNAVKIVHTIAQDGGIDTPVSNTTSAVVIEGGQKIQISEPADNNIKISTGDYGVKTAGSKNAVDVVLTYTPDGGTAADEEKVTLKPSANSLMEITQSGNVISFNTNPIQDVVSDQNITSAQFDAGNLTVATPTNEGFTLTLTKGDSSSVKAHVNPQITYGKAEYGTGQHTHGFTGGVDTLHVYTIDQTNKLISDSLMNFNALTYCGTVGGTGATVGALPQKEVSIGDVYMSTGDKKVKLTATGEEVLYDAGTLFIATSGEKDNNGKQVEGVDGFIPENKVVWTRVDNYNADTVFGIDTGTKNTIKFFNKVTGGADDGANNHIGSFTVKTDSSEDNPLTVADITDEKAPLEQIIQVTHNLSSFKEVAKATVVNEGITKTLFAGKALGSVTIDNYGHVKTITEVPLIVPTEVFSESESLSTVAVSEKDATGKVTATFSDKISLINSAETGTVSDITLKNQISSQTLTLVKDGDNVMKMDLVWGEF